MLVLLTVGIYELRRSEGFRSHDMFAKLHEVLFSLPIVGGYKLDM
jgi:hypothetical protein